MPYSKAALFYHLQISTSVSKDKYYISIRWHRYATSALRLGVTVSSEYTLKLACKLFNLFQFPNANI